MEQYGLQAFVGLLAAFVLQWLKQQHWFPFLNTWSAKWWKIVVSAVVAAASALGISYSYDPTLGRLIIDGLTWSSIGHGLLAFGVSFLSQHLAYEGVARRVLPASKVLGVLLAATLAAGVTTGCAATTARAKAQTTAMVSTELVLAIDQAEWDAYAAGLYDEAHHQTIGSYIRALLLAERGYVRAVRAWPTGEPVSAPTTVMQARQALVAAVADLRAGLTGLRGVDAIVRALEAFEAACGLPSEPLAAETGWIGLLVLLLKMIADGRLTRDKILFWLKQDGATDAELAEAERALTDAIARRDHDLGTPS